MLAIIYSFFTKKKKEQKKDSHIGLFSHVNHGAPGYFECSRSGLATLLPSVVKKHQSDGCENKPARPTAPRAPIDLLCYTAWAASNAHISTELPRSTTHGSIQTLKALKCFFELGSFGVYYLVVRVSDEVWGGEEKKREERENRNVCVCVWERERERERERALYYKNLTLTTI